MERLFFEQIKGKIYKYTVLNYTLREGLNGRRVYVFTDIFDGLQRELDEEMYRGKEQVSEEECARYVSRRN